jgi:hypothetical protein
VLQQYDKDPGRREARVDRAGQDAKKIGAAGPKVMPTPYWPRAFILIRHKNIG